MAARGAADRAARSTEVLITQQVRKGPFFSPLAGLNYFLIILQSIQIFYGSSRRAVS